MKLKGELSDRKYFECVYNMHTDSPILQQIEVRQGKILDTDYTRVDISDMVDNLDIACSSMSLKNTLRNFLIYMEVDLAC